MSNILLSEVAAKLKTPESIDIFVRSLTAVESPLEEPKIEELLEKCSGDKRALQQWFNTSLSPHEQLITIGLCLFEGLYDDQFFAVMETLIEQSWHKRDMTLQGLDYCDLDALISYYRLDSPGQTDLKKIESRLPKQRHELLKMAWDTHRRQIFSALPVIEDLVKNSVLKNNVNREIFSSSKKCRLIREVASETLSAIGLKSINSIEDTLYEDTLLRLAAEENLEVQAVAARAMAQWRVFNQDEKLFDTLQRWQLQTTARQIIRSILENKNPDIDITPQIYIKATIALTVGFASLYDPPNQLDATLCKLLEQLAKDASNPFIRSRLANYTLPLVTRFHSSLLRGMLYDMAKNPLLSEPIGASLASAIREGVEESAKILDSWFHRCNRERPERYSKKEITHREALMAVAAYAYGWLDYEENDGLVSADKGFERLTIILKNEVSPHVRKAAVEAAILQIIFNLEKAEKYLEYLLSSMDNYEQKTVIEGLVQEHLEQRVQLKGGDEYFKWQGHLYEAWLNEERPLTPIEEMVRKWIKNCDNRITQQVAFRLKTSKSLVDFEKEEEKFIDQAKKKMEEQEEMRRANERVYQSPLIETTNADNNVTGSLITRILTTGEEKCRELVRGVLPEVLKQKAANRVNLDFALKKLRSDPDDDLQVLAKILERVLSFLDNRLAHIVAIVLLVLSIIALVLIFNT